MGTWQRTLSYSVIIDTVFTGRKAASRDGDQSSQSKFEVVNVWCYTFCTVCLSEVMRNSQLNLLKPTGHVMHQKFNIQQL